MSPIPATVGPGVVPLRALDYQKTPATTPLLVNRKTTRVHLCAGPRKLPGPKKIIL
jgi:hypothetical protein